MPFSSTSFVPMLAMTALVLFCSLISANGQQDEHPTTKGEGVKLLSSDDLAKLTTDELVMYYRYLEAIVGGKWERRKKLISQ